MNNILFTNDDINLLNRNKDKLLDDVEQMKKDYFKPSVETQQKIIDAILDFTKEKKRKLYGGYALNELIKTVSPKNTFYTPGSINDVDFYSPHPVQDVYALCDKLYALNVGTVRCKDAMHDETYTIKVDDELYCDITYVPSNIYHRMPFKTSKDGLYLIHPHFMWIDYLRILTDPMSSWTIRMEKSYNRFKLLQEHYKFPQNLNGITCAEPTPDLESGLGGILKFLKGRDTTVTVGFYAYNCFLDASMAYKKKSRSRNRKNKGNIKHTRQRTSNSTIDFVNIPYYDIITSDYKKDATELIESLKALFPDEKDVITCVEHYPFFQLTGFGVWIYCNGELIARIYDNSKKCLPYRDIDGKFFHQDRSKHESLGGMIRIGTFGMCLLHTLIMIQYHRVNNDNDSKELNYTLASHFIHMRNFFFDTHDNTILDDTLFQDMVIQCVGEPTDPGKERRLRIESRLEQKKQATFNYNPEKPRKSLYNFANSSGNPIRNSKNLKLAICGAAETDKNYETDETDETDETNEKNKKNNKSKKSKKSKNNESDESSSGNDDKDSGGSLTDNNNDANFLVSVPTTEEAGVDTIDAVQNILKSAQKVNSNSQVDLDFGNASEVSE